MQNALVLMFGDWHSSRIYTPASTALSKFWSWPQICTYPDSLFPSPCITFHIFLFLHGLSNAVHFKGSQIRLLGQWFPNSCKWTGNSLNLDGVCALISLQWCPCHGYPESLKHNWERDLWSLPEGPGGLYWVPTGNKLWLTNSFPVCDLNSSQKWAPVTDQSLCISRRVCRRGCVLPWPFGWLHLHPLVCFTDHGPHSTAITVALLLYQFLGFIPLRVMVHFLFPLVIKYYQTCESAIN